MRNVYKWRIINTKYAYITDENSGEPFIFDKLTGKRFYPSDRIESGVNPDDSLISIQSSKLSLVQYTDKFNKLKVLCQNDSDGKTINFLDVKEYYDFSKDECVEEALTPKCEGFDPIFDVETYSIEAGEEPQSKMEIEKNNDNKTVKYKLLLGIPKGEKGEPGEQGETGATGATGSGRGVGNVYAQVIPLDFGETPTVDVEQSEGTSGVNLDFIFGIPPGPKGDKGENGADGEKGDTGANAHFKSIKTNYEIVSDTGSTYVNVVTGGTPEEVDMTFKFGLTQGIPGDKGEQGLPAKFTEAKIGTVEIAEDEEPEVTVDLEKTNPDNNEYTLTFNFKLPKGEQGETGPVGPAPKLKSENNTIYVSYDDGESWSELIYIGGGGGTSYSAGNNITITSGNKINAIGYTWDSGTTTFSVDGKVESSNGFFETSDARKKDILSDISLDKCYQLLENCQTVLFELKNDENHNKHIGTIAQEVKEFFPEIVSGSEENGYTIDYSKLSVICLRILKDLNERVKKLENK